MMVGLDFQVRPAVLDDQRQIANLMHLGPFVHRHLDWRYPLDWIGTPPFYVLEDHNQIAAAMACPPDPPMVAWVRLFLSSGRISLRDSWLRLWLAASQDLAGKSKTIIAAIVLQNWMPELLISSGMETHQSIVMLEREKQNAVEVDLPQGFQIRPMLQQDLTSVADVDAEAFESLWQNSLLALEYAYPQGLFPTLVEFEGKIIGYQLSTRNPMGAHLARLAVLPAMQGKGVGKALVADFIQQIERHGMNHLTVNTQSDNTTSLALYRHIGFKETGERYPVYQLQIP
jgi:ribosomal protein S18 acetylase RimI-like enzyme